MTTTDASAIEASVIEILQRTGPCCLDDVVASLPHLCWGEVFIVVDRMSRDGRLLVRQLSYMSYDIALPPQLASSRSPAPQGEAGAPTTPLDVGF